jgi:hypothetical protein
MSIDMVLNELSLTPPFIDIHAARGGMSRFIQTLIAATRRGLRASLRTSVIIHGALLGPNYVLAQWRNDAAVDREEQRFFRSLTTKYPLLSEIDDATGEDTFGLTDCTCNGARSSGLAFAYVFEALPVSVRSAPQWETNTLSVTVSQLRGDDLSTEAVELRHASSPEHVDQHSDWIQKELQRSVTNGDQLWQRRTELFPHVNFCSTVEEQLSPLNDSMPVFRHLLARLTALETFGANWIAGAFDSRNLAFNARPESQATLEKFADQRTFTCPDGIRRVFSWHTSLPPHAWRLHFNFALGPGLVLVGYVGPHLEIVSNPS